jgi:NTP pyrophosphatase (non-canonical NTP hydrolase)
MKFELNKTYVLKDGNKAKIVGIDTSVTDYPYWVQILTGDYTNQKMWYDVLGRSVDHREAIEIIRVAELPKESEEPNLNTLAASIFQANKSVGWWPENVNERNKGELIALMHSELSEALEALRKDRMDDHLPYRKGEEVELADAIIRILDYAGAFGLDLDGAVKEKLAYNKQRADHKLENRQKDGGKAF